LRHPDLFPNPNCLQTRKDIDHNTLPYLGGKAACREAIRLPQDADKHMKGKLQQAPFQEISCLHTQYKAKRNFRKWLAEACPGLLKQT